MQDRKELIKNRRWSYVYNTQFTENLEEYIQRKAKNDFSAPNSRDPILKPVLHLGFVTSNKETRSTINLRVSCYLNDNNEKSFKIFTSYSTDNNSAFEYFKNNLNESWIKITDSKISDNHFFTYVETEELFEQEEIGYFIEAVNKYYHLPSDLYHEFQEAAGISNNLHSSSSFAALLANKRKVSQEKNENELLSNLAYAH